MAWIAGGGRTRRREAVALRAARVLGGRRAAELPSAPPQAEWEDGRRQCEGGKAGDMGSIRDYVLWRGHDCDGAMPPVDVLAGVLPASARPAQAPRLEEDEVLVVVPPQWLGDWADGARLAPCYQHVWRVSLRRLDPLPAVPTGPPYRPATLPPSASGTSSRWPRRRR